MEGHYIIDMNLQIGRGIRDLKKNRYKKVNIEVGEIMYKMNIVNYLISY